MYSSYVFILEHNMGEVVENMKPKVAFATHAHDMVDFDAHFNHLYSVAHWVDMYDVFFIGRKGLQAAEARNLIADMAIEHGCEYLFILDADHIITKRTLPLLMENRNEAMVSGLVCKRLHPYPQVAWLKGTDGKYFTITLPLDGTLAEVGVCPFGCTLINIAKLKKLKKPYFRDTCNVASDGNMVNVRSDVNLSEMFRESGEKIWVDTRVLVGHLGPKKLIYPQNAEYYRSSDTIAHQMTELRYGMRGDHAGMRGITK